MTTLLQPTDEPATLLSPTATLGRPARVRVDDWLSALGDADERALPDCDDRNWRRVRTPHNWEDYHGYPEVSHGNLHGTAWYRHGFFRPENWREDGRLFAFFEGVGSYATVYCNGVGVGEHAGGRTTFTVELTAALRAGRNLLAVRAHHPDKIDDLPFVCGGCWGSPNTEGSQPFGIFRPVWLEHTGPARVEPFGVHVLTPELSRRSARIEARAEIDAGPAVGPVVVRSSLVTPDGKVAERREHAVCAGGGVVESRQPFTPIANPRLWGPADPALHRVVTELFVGGELSHRAETSFGLRWLEWPRIDEPQADRNVRSPDRRGRMVSTGETPRTPENNGHTALLDSSSAAAARLAPMGAVVRAINGRIEEIEVALEISGREGAAAAVLCEIQNEGGSIFFHQHRSRVEVRGGRATLRWAVPAIHRPHLWRPDDPYLHRLLVEIRSRDGALWERSETLFGLRAREGVLNLARPEFDAAVLPSRIHPDPEAERRLLLNGEPLFLNGTCEYEHLLGADHSFSDEQIAARVAMMRAAGFNAFRDAHHPHNLRYYDHWDRAGIVCWTQMGSRVWFDNPRFRENHRRLVREWVRERRNHPSVILWGLQNESALPEPFAREMRDLIRELDPTSPASRPVVTCNGGKGADWNVPQEWSGTYGGNCHDYALEALQMVGEYGVWREFGSHRETAYRGDENDRSESWACFAIETKIRLAEEARSRAIGHFHWLFNSFANPGRTATNHEGPGNGRIGSINNKGLVTVWSEPSDLFHLFRANFADPAAAPMVYIVSHTWPDRWRTPGPRAVSVFSNCEEVELFSGVRERSLGVRPNPGRGRRFTWENVTPVTALLCAVGRVGGREAACDLIALDHLPADPNLPRWIGAPRVIDGRDGALFRVSCGSSHPLKDGRGRVWAADRPWNADAAHGTESWADEHAPRVSRDLASVGRTLVPARGAENAELYQTYRYGRDRLKFRFRTGAGRFSVRLHFVEPWFGVGGGLDCRGWRLFDIAVNDRTLERDFDIWARAGGDHRALAWERIVDIADDVLTVHFPSVRCGQALVCAIEICAA